MFFGLTCVCCSAPHFSETEKGLSRGAVRTYPVELPDTSGAQCMPGTVVYARLF